MCYNAAMSQKFTAIVQRDGAFWIGWIVEVPGVNGQGRTRPALLDSLRSALREALEMNRRDALSAAQQPYEQEIIEVEAP
jgi:predicted RNase H-like HicB family nuclease